MPRTKILKGLKIYIYNKMVVKCPRCKETFEYPYLLKKHENRKFQCKLVEPEYKCQICLKTLSCEKVLKRHNCKYKDCEIRKMEMELGIQIEPIFTATKCRFCNTEYTVNKNLIQHMKVCKQKESYKENLKKQLEKGKEPARDTETQGGTQGEVHNVTNNNNNSHNNQTINQTADTIVNGNMNNITINLVPFGQENFDYIDTKVVMRLADKYLKMKRDMTGFIRAVTRLMHAHPNHPENHNVLMHGMNKPQATVYTERGFELRNAVEMTGKIVMNGGEAVLTTYEEAEKEDQRKIGERQYLKVEDIVSEGEHTRKFGSFRNAAKVALSDPKVRTTIKETQKKKQKEEEEKL